MSQNGNNKKKTGLLKVLIWTAAILTGSLFVMEAVLTTSLPTNIVNNVAGKYIDGNISFGKVSLSVLKRFPNICLVLDDFSITYPADRFDESEKYGAQGALMYQGSGPQADTLASFDRFYTKISIFHLLADHLRIPDIELDSPRIFAHSYYDGKANWDIFKLEKDPDDTTKTILPKLSIGKIEVRNNSNIIYTDSKESIFAMIELKKAGFEGNLTTRRRSRNRVGLSVDSMFVAGRVAEDTVALGLDLLHIHQHDDHIDVEADLKTTLATHAFGRMNVPVKLSSTLHFPEDSVFALGVHNFKADIAALPFEGEADLRFHPDRVEMNGELAVTECSIDDIMKKFVRNFIPEADKIKTDAVIGINARCRGDYVYASGKLPVFNVDVIMPEATFSHSDLGEEVTLAFDAYVANTRRGIMNLNINDMAIGANGIRLSAYGGASDILSADPSITIDGSIVASLDSLMRFIPDSLDMTARGNIEAKISGSANLSHLSMYTFSQSELTGQAVSDSIVFSMPGDSISVSLKGIELALGPENRTSRRDSSRTFRLVGLSGKVGELAASYKEAITASGKEIKITAQNSAGDTLSINRLGGRLSARELTVKDVSGTRIDLDGTQNGFQMMPKRDNPKIPVLTVSSSNDRIALMTDVNRAILNDASVEARATMTGLERRSRVQRDSLTRRSRSRRPSREVPKDDFADQDIDIRLDQSIAKYFREWDMSGDLSVRRGIIMTPYFPLRNVLQGMAISVSNDRISIDSLKVRSGESSIEAKGELTGLRRALAGGRGRSNLNLTIDMRTDGMDANEILSAYTAGSHFNAEEVKDKMADATDDEFLEMVISDTAETDENMKLIVVPGNLNADINLSGKDIKWSDLTIYEMNSDLRMMDRCVQLTNTMATSNVGNVSFEGFYATRSREDIKAGFNFEFMDITAEKAIDMMPAMDTIMPLLKSFAGKLDCELAATASLDTNMNILMPTINGIMRISGNNLTISENEMFTSIAKKLKFDDRNTGLIQNMRVEGVIQDNVLEVFPFVVKLDRYTLALSGKQNLDMSYRYHASVIRSPILIKVGVDVYGPDFDNMKFKVCKPKYKNEKVPVFTTVIDETKINLAESIRGIFEKGVDAAVQENSRQEAISRRRQEIGYVNAVDQETETIENTQDNE